MIFALVTAAFYFYADLTSVQANSDIFPAEPAAQNAVTWKDGYFWIKGKPTLLTSGEMHYARIPRDLWQDRIWRAREMGLNCVQTYVFWNASECREGEWDFSDNLDLDAWLTTLQQEDMYAVVRVGPYSCAEWDQGGFPAWLTVKPDMTLRDMGEQFDRSAYQHLDQVEKIVASHQINHGGNVIMVQLENEHPSGWGTDGKNSYLAHLVEQARTNGLEIPLFLSGLHHGNDPAGDSPFTVGASPWYSTEFWTGWIGKYGNMASGMLQQKIAGTWKIIAFGGAGYDYYVVHGGTNFGYSGFSHDATYDYAAPISEFGGFNNFYAPAKRAAYFAQSFSDLLTGSHNDPNFARADSGVRATTRTNPTLGSLILLDRFGKNSNRGQIAPSAVSFEAPAAVAAGPVETHVIAAGLALPHRGALSVENTEPSMILVNLPWTDHAYIASVCSNVLLRRQMGAIDYWICYGTPGGTGEIILTKDGKAAPPIKFTYPTDNSVNEIELDSGDERHAKVLVMSTALTARTWLAQGKIYIGPSFVNEDGSVEFPPSGGAATIYSERGKQVLTQGTVPVPDVPDLAVWQWRDAAPERSGNLMNVEWRQTSGPQPIGAVDSYQNRYAWYRTTLEDGSASSVSLHFAGGPGPNCVAFLNGQPADLGKLAPHPGDNTLAILVKAEPRGTLYNKTGMVSTPIIRGCWGGTSTSPQGLPLTLSWKTWKSKSDPGKAEDVAGPAYDDSTWSPTAKDDIDDAARTGRWLRGKFTLSAKQIDSFIEAPNFEKWGCSLYLNGRQLPSFTEDISKILVAGTNVILLLPHDSKADLHDLALTLWPNAPLAHAPWYFHGGLCDLQETPIIGRVTNWVEFLTKQPWQRAEEATPDLPAFWKSSFVYHPSATVRATLGLSTEGLRTGHVWLNGHNLGECPQNVPLYMPECWLRDGSNDLVIFDLYGNRPDRIKISRYEAHAVMPPFEGL